MLTATDLFAGAVGSTTGAEEAGVEVKLAVEVTVCKGCYALGESIDIHGYEQGGIEHTLYPCPTIQALDGGGTGE